MASRYFVTGSGGNSNWGQTGAGSNWSLTDGGAGGQAVPTSSDDVFFTSNSPACTVDTSTRAALTLNFTGYAQTITFNANINVSGSVTLGSGMSFAGSSTLVVIAAATLTANGKTCGVPLAISTTGTVTLADAWTVSGLLSLTSTGLINGFSLTAQAGQTTNGNTSASSTTTLTLSGTGTVTWSATHRLATTINTAGTITFATGSQLLGCNLTYTAGTVVTTSVTLTCSTAVTLDTNGITWNAVTLSGSVTMTLGSNMLATGLVTIGSGSGALVLNGFQLTCRGGLTYGSSGIASGTTVYLIDETCTLQNSSTGTLTNPLTINAPGKTVSVTSGFRCDLGKTTYTAGTVVPSGGTQWASGGGAVVPTSITGAEGVLAL